MLNVLFILEALRHNYIMPGLLPGWTRKDIEQPRGGGGIRADLEDALNCAAILQNIIWLSLGRQFPLPSRFTWYVHVCLRESSDKELGIHWFEWLGDTKWLSLLTDYNMFWKYWEARQTRLSQRSRANTTRPGLIKLLLHAAIMPVISPFVA